MEEKMFELVENPGASFELEETFAASAVIKVLGVGGAGGNAVNRMIEAGVRGVEFIAMNTDMQSLGRSLAPVKLQLGAKLTGGKGVGADPEKGRQAAIESEAEIAALVKGADMVFIAAGMGKGTGTGAAPVVAEIARGMGILTIPVVTRPFSTEGPACLRRAEAGLKALKAVTDSVVVIANDRIMTLAARVPFQEACRQVDDTLRHAIQSISDVVTSEGMMNCDFNDVRSIMNEKGGIYMGAGAADGEDCALRAAEMALSNPYLDGAQLKGARGILVMISVKDQARFSAQDLSTVLECVGGMGTQDTNLINGLAYNPAQAEQLRVTLIAAGFDPHSEAKAEAKGEMDWLKGLQLTLPASKGPGHALPSPSAEDLEIPAFLRRRHVESLEKALKAA